MADSSHPQPSNAVDLLLQLTDLRKEYRQGNGETLAILDVPTFRVNRGEQAVLIGPSGCGKTTLLHIIAGISSATAGSVRLDGVELTRFSEAVRDRIRADKIGYVFQTFNLLPGFSALENVVLGMTFARGKKDVGRARDLLQRVGLGHRLHHKPGSMSVGEQQRVAVARALANRPLLLLADEPTANVDPLNQQQIVDLIKDSCQQENIAMILVTHSMQVAEQFERVDKLQEINRVVSEAIAQS